MYSYLSPFRNQFLRRKQRFLSLYGNILGLPKFFDLVKIYETTTTPQLDPTHMRLHKWLNERRFYSRMLLGFYGIQMYISRASGNKFPGPMELFPGVTIIFPGSTYVFLLVSFFRYQFPRRKQRFLSLYGNILGLPKFFDLVKIYETTTTPQLDPTHMRLHKWLNERRFYSRMLLGFYGIQMYISRASGNKFPGPMELFPGVTIIFPGSTYVFLLVSFFRYQFPRRKQRFLSLYGNILGFSNFIDVVKIYDTNHTCTRSICNYICDFNKVAAEIACFSGCLVSTC